MLKNRWSRIRVKYEMVVRCVCVGVGTKKKKEQKMGVL